jgi:hypothetical protein
VLNKSASVSLHVLRKTFVSGKLRDDGVERSQKVVARLERKKEKQNK